MTSIDAKQQQALTLASAQELEARIDTIMAHAWMVRTFVKHSEEVEDFPELMQVVRTIFDTARALETKRGNPVGVLAMLRKKFSKLKAAAEQFRVDAPRASTHMNFAQAVLSLDGCIRALEEILAQSQDILAALRGHTDEEDA